MINRLDIDCNIISFFADTESDGYYIQTFFSDIDISTAFSTCIYIEFIRSVVRTYFEARVVVVIKTQQVQRSGPRVNISVFDGFSHTEAVSPAPTAFFKGRIRFCTVLSGNGITYYTENDIRVVGNNSRNVCRFFDGVRIVVSYIAVSHLVRESDLVHAFFLNCYVIASRNHIAPEIGEGLHGCRIVEVDLPSVRVSELELRISRKFQAGPGPSDFSLLDLNSGLSVGSDICPFVHSA